MFSLFSSFVLCFFKQKTAYEMRISDWSLDVCSSDLSVGHRMGFVEDDDSVKVLPCPFENLLEPGRVAAARAQCRIGDEEDALAHSDRDTELPLAKGLNVDRKATERAPIAAGIFEQSFVLGNPDVAPFTPQIGREHV